MERTRVAFERQTSKLRVGMACGEARGEGKTQEHIAAEANAGFDYDAMLRTPRVALGASGGEERATKLEAGPRMKAASAEREGRGRMQAKTRARKSSMSG
jgi:hypothetical protein